MEASESLSTKEVSLLAACVAVNSLPLFMFFLFEWSILDLIFLYWAENVIIGLLIFCKLLSPVKESNVLTALFFLTHYGLFCYVHLTFVFSIFGKDLLIGNSTADLFEKMNFLVNEHYLYFSIICFFIFHLIDFIKGRSYQGFEKDFKSMITPKFFGDDVKKKSSGIFSAENGPYNRIVVLHLTIMITAFLINVTHLHEIFGLLILVLLKTVLDIHFRNDSDKSIDPKVV